MTDGQFDTLLAGAKIAHEEDLHRLGSLLNAVALVGNSHSSAAVTDLLEWGVKVAQDMVTHRRKRDEG